MVVNHLYIVLVYGKVFYKHNKYVIWHVRLATLAAMQGMEPLPFTSVMNVDDGDRS